MSHCPSSQSHPSPLVSQALSFPSPPVPWLGTPSQCCTPPGWTACLPALLGSGTARGGSGRPGGWDNDHMKFPTLPHPIRKQAGRDAGGWGCRLGGILWLDGDVQGFSPVVQGCGWKSHRGLVISRKQLGDANGSHRIWCLCSSHDHDKWFQLFLSQCCFFFFVALSSLDLRCFQIRWKDDLRLCVLQRTYQKYLAADTETKQASTQPMKTNSAEVYRRICYSIHGGESPGRSHVSRGEPSAGLQLPSWAAEAAALCDRQPSIPARTQAEHTQRPSAKEVGECFPSGTPASPRFQRQICPILSNRWDVSQSSRTEQHRSHLQCAESNVFPPFSLRLWWSCEVL